MRRSEDVGWHVPAAKVAYMRFDDLSRPVFRPMCGGRGLQYGFDSMAVCSLGCDKVPPNLDCSCGFYAVTSRDRALALFGHIHYEQRVLLNVALMGKVALFDGWGPYRGTIVRAQYQRILSCETALEWRGSEDAMWRRAMASLNTADRRGQPRPHEDGGSLARLREPLEPCPGSDWVSVPTPDWPSVEVPLAAASVLVGASTTRVGR